MDPTIRRRLFCFFTVTFPHLVFAFRQYEKLLISVKNKKLQKQFLQDCLLEQVIPTVLRPSLYRQQDNPFPDSAKYLLKESIQCVQREIEETYFRLRRSFGLLKENLPQDILQVLQDVAQLKCISETNKTRVRLNCKLNRLCQNSVWNNCGLTNCVINLSSYVLSEVEKAVLSFGLSFALKPNKDVVLDFVSSNIGKSNFACLSGMVLQSFVKHFQSQDSIPRRFRAALANLKNRDNIHITKADKSNSVVILDKRDYETKMENLLSDNVTYEKLRSSPLRRLASQFNKRVRELFKDAPGLEVNNFLQINPCLPYIYGLPKTHKQQIPLRPIISQCGSFTYKVSKFLANKLSPLVGTFSNSHINNSMDFIDKIKSLDFHLGKMVSLDVDSLFTKVPVDDVLDFLRRKLPSSDIDLGMPLDNFIELVKLCVKSNAFSFGSNYYIQRFGMSMGSPLSPILSNIYMEYFESELLPNIAPQGLIWFRYVDDIFSFWPSNFTNFDNFFNALNNMVPSIKFKVEWEKDDFLPFLDVKVMKKDYSQSFSVYRKPTHCDLYIHYFSYHNSSTKHSVISSMFLRAFRICSPQHLDNEVSYIWKTFLSLKYPDWFIKKSYFKARQSYFKPKPPPSIKKSFVSVPYISELNNIVTLNRNLDVQIAFKYTSTLKSMLVKNKNVEPTTAGVYKIPCRDCDNVYIGETGRDLDTRIKEHKYAFRSGNTNNAIFLHASENNHVINWNNSNMLYKCRDFKKRRIVESICIDKYKNFNICEGHFKLDQVMRELVVKSLPPDLIPPDVT